MKLYATVTSERASKSQGGNKYIDILLYVGSATNSMSFADVRLNIVDDKYVLWVDGKKIKEAETIESKSHKQYKTPVMVIEEERLKGNKQKGINRCEHKDTTKTPHGTYCLDCHAYL